MKKIYILLLGLIILIGCGLFYFKTNPLMLGKRYGNVVVDKKPIVCTIDSCNITAEEAYKLCTKQSCISHPVTIEGFITSYEDGIYLSTGTGNIIDKESKKKYITMAWPSVKLISYDGIELFKILNWKNYSLGDGILKIRVKGTLEHETIYTIEAEDRVNLYVKTGDITVLSEAGCRTYPSTQGYCFEPAKYSIEDAYNKLLSSTYGESLKDTNIYICRAYYKIRDESWVFITKSKGYAGCMGRGYGVSKENIDLGRTFLGY